MAGTMDIYKFDLKTLPDTITEPCKLFLQESQELLSFISLLPESPAIIENGISRLVHAVSRFAEMSMNLIELLKKLSVVDTSSNHDKTEETHKQLQEMISEQNSVLQEQGERLGIVAAYNSYQRLMLEMAYCRATDVFLLYLSGLVTLIFRTNPNTLKSNETIEVKEILEHDKMEDLITYIIEERVTNIAFKGMKAISEYLSKRLDYNLFTNDKNLAKAVHIIEYRNLIVHNHGIVNRLSLSKSPDLPAKGTWLPLDTTILFDDITFLVNTVLDIDQRAASKFKLPQRISKQTLIDDKGWIKNHS